MANSAPTHMNPAPQPQVHYETCRHCGSDRMHYVTPVQMVPPATQPVGTQPAGAPILFSPVIYTTNPDAENQNKQNDDRLPDQIERLRKEVRALRSKLKKKNGKKRKRQEGPLEAAPRIDVTTSSDTIDQAQNERIKSLENMLNLLRTDVMKYNKDVTDFITAYNAKLTTKKPTVAAVA